LGTTIRGFPNLNTSKIVPDPSPEFSLVYSLFVESKQLTSMADDEVCLLAVILNGRLELPYLYIHTVSVYRIILSIGIFRFNDGITPLKNEASISRVTKCAEDRF